MGNEGSNYNRVEDQEWRKSVESRLVSLTSAQKQTDDEFDKLGNRLDEADQLLEGDPLKRDDSGLKGDVAELHRKVSELHAIMAPDALGHGGIKNRLATVERRYGIEEKNIDNRSITRRVIAVAIIGLIGAALSNLDRVERFVKSFVGKKPDSSLTSKRGSGKAGKKPRRPPARESVPEGDNDATREEVSE